MNASVSIGVGAGAFLLALGAVMWWQAGPAVFTAITQFGLMICG
ncbi:MAG: hypothetical protein AAGB11_00555 [Pseudomonadota bacterium]